MTTSPSSSTAYISNLRSYLTILVILHHAAIAYGGEGPGHYQSSHHPVGSSPVLVAFNAVNQTFFMATFMFIAGNFSRKALERKGRGVFVRDRVRRLMVPSLMYTVFGDGFCAVVGGGGVGFGEFFGGLRGLRGPVWFTGTLFWFDVCLVGWTRMEGEFRLMLRPFAIIALCSIVDFFIRIISPVGRTLPPLGLQPAYITQYIFSYIAGATIPSLLNIIPTSSPTIWTLRSLSILTSSILLSTLHSSVPAMEGGFNTLALTYALWNNVTGYVIGSQLWLLFSRRCKGSWGWVNGAAFTAFLVHMPVMTVIGVLTDDWEGSGVVKATCVGVVTAMLSFGMGFSANRSWKSFNEKKSVKSA